ncbi:hypothetical protein ACHQM5_012719 [Ranunculus cassubicifolius]
MNSSDKLLSLLIVISLSTTQAAAPMNSKLLFREYIGAEDKNVKLTDVPINPNVDFHFLLAFAIDYTTSASPSPTSNNSNVPTNGHFNVFWDTVNLTPSQISSIKNNHSNVKVGVSLGGDSVPSGSVNFAIASVDSWVQIAVISLTKIIKDYNLDGIDIDYEHFTGDPNTFAECIGRLITILKQNKVIEFASIAPFDDDQVQSHYMALWKKYGRIIDYVNFQFYAYAEGTIMAEFLRYYEIQSKNYKGGKMLVSFGTDHSGGLSPRNGFFGACWTLKRLGKLNGIFIWSADCR